MKQATMKRRTYVRASAAKAAAILAALLALSASSAASQDSKYSQAWYADKFRKLGFTYYGMGRR